MKQCETDMDTIPPTSPIKKCASSQKLAQQPMEVFMSQSHSIQMSSSLVRKQFELSQKKEFHVRGRRGISSEADLRDEEVVEKGEGDDISADENADQSSRSKKVNVADKREIVRKCHECPKCDYVTTNATHLRTHINAVHEGVRPFACKICNFKSSQASHLQQHVNEVHEGIRPYKCEHCNYRASRTADLRKHVDAVDAGKKPHQCHYCDYRASVISNLRRHINKVHKGIKPYNCALCDYAASRPDTLRYHMNARHGEMKKCDKGKDRATSTCSIKKRTSSQKLQKSKEFYSIDKVAMEQIDGIGIYVDETIVDSCRSKNASIADAKVITPKFHECPQCDYVTQNATHLRTHINAVHEGRRPYASKMCDFRSSQAINLERHVNEVHDVIRPYRCEHCDYRASRIEVLRKHVDAVHEGKRSHHCPHCDYRATQAIQLRLHVRTMHDKIKPHKCRLCDYEAPRPDYLRNHMKSRHVE